MAADTGVIWARRVAIIGAVLGWTGLVLQYSLLLQDMGGWGEALWRFVGYFTLLTNLWVTLVFTNAALRPAKRTGLGGPRMVFAATVAILLVGIVYTVALRSLWTPEGLTAVADHIVHDAMPVLCALFWWLQPHGRIGWREALWALAWPSGYFVYAMARGAFDGWYAYWFLNPTGMPAAEMALSVGLLLLGVLVLAQVLAGLDRMLGGQGT